MADEPLRQLERRWRESGSSATEQAYLQALRRNGRVDAGALEALALLGHRAARDLRRPTLLTPEEMAELAGVEPSTLLKWGRDRECPRRPAKESPRKVKGKFVHDPLEVLDWRHARIDYLLDGHYASRLLMALLRQHSVHAAQRTALAAAWSALLGHDQDTSAHEALLVRVEAALVRGEAAHVDVEEPRGPFFAVDEQTVRSPGASSEFVARATRFLAYGVGRADQAFVGASFDWAYWTIVASTIRSFGVHLDRTLRRKFDTSALRYIHHPWAGLLRWCFRQVLATALVEVNAWALGADPVAARVAEREQDPGRRVVPEHPKAP